MSRTRRVLATTDPLYGRIYLSELEYKIIQTWQFKRLKRIKQLSFAQLVYPSANHTRYEHSLGARYICNEMIKSLSRTCEIEEGDKKIVRVAALLHDIGHPAFSHASEFALKGLNLNDELLSNHEDATRAKILEKEEIFDILKQQFSCKEIELIANIATGATFNLPKNKQFLSDMVAGDFGCDRIDYLRRDAYYTGTAYGSIEISELINHLCVVEYPEGHRRLAIELENTRAGLDAASFLLLARSYHFSRIVHQGKIRAGNAMLSRAIKHYLTNECPDPNKFVKDLFFTYDDSSLLRDLTLSGDEFVKKLAKCIREEKIIGYEIGKSFIRRLDDFPPEFRYYLLLIDFYKKTHHFEEKCENLIKNTLKEGETVIVDLNVNGLRGVPTEVFVKSSSDKEVRSILAFDKSPLLLELATSLVKAGIFSIYSTKSIRLDYKQIFELAKETVEDIRTTEKIIPSEFLLMYIYRGASKKISKHSKNKKYMLCDGFPGIGKLMKDMKSLCEKSKEKLNFWQNKLKGREFTVLANEGGAFYFNKLILRDIFLLMGVQFLMLNRKPIGFETLTRRHINCWNYNGEITSMIDRWDFHVTYDGKMYLFNKIPDGVKEIYETLYSA